MPAETKVTDAGGRAEMWERELVTPSGPKRPAKMHRQTTCSRAIPTAYTSPPTRFTETRYVSFVKNPAPLPEQQLADTKHNFVDVCSMGLRKQSLNLLTG